MGNIMVLTVIICLAAVLCAGEMSAADENRSGNEAAVYFGDYADRVAAGEMPPFKCGTPILNDPWFDRSKDALSTALFTEREDSMSFTYGTDHFLLHYTDNGANRIYEYDVQNLQPGIPDYVVEAGLAFENVYQTEIEVMGFLPPPSDGTAGGDGRMDVYFIHNAFYGATVVDSMLSTFPLTATAYIFVENDFAGFPGYESNPIPAVTVTAAHEFFHTVQFGIDISELEVIESVPNPAWIEMSATFMEEEVYPDVNDYVNYVPFFYDFPQWSLRTGTSQISPSVNMYRNMHMYGSVVWPIFLRRQFGPSIIKDIWDRCGLVAGPNWWMATDDAILAASDDTLDMRGMFREFTLWNLFTDTRTRPGLYFPDAEHYPPPQFLDPVTGYPTTVNPYNSIDLDSLYPDNWGANYILLENLTGALTISFNPERTQPWGLQVVKFVGGIDDPIVIEPTVFDSATTEFQIPAAADYQQIVLIPSVLGGEDLRVPYSIDLSVATGVDNRQADHQRPSEYSLSQNRPNPFNPATDISFQLPRSSKVKLEIFDILSRKIISLVDRYLPAGRHDFRWDGKEADGRPAPSGIYLYRLQADDFIETRQMILMK